MHSIRDALKFTSSRSYEQNQPGRQRLMEILLRGSTHVKMQEMLHKREGVVVTYHPLGVTYLPFRKLEDGMEEIRF